MESNFAGFDPTSGYSFDSFIDHMLSQIRECSQNRKPIKLKCQGSKLRIFVSGMKFAASEVKRVQL